jgi:hypothetical protein
LPFPGSVPSLDSRLHLESSLRFHARDRRRITLAVVTTLIALPALWFVQRDDRADDAEQPDTAPVVDTTAAPASDPDDRHEAIERASEDDSMFLSEDGTGSPSAAVDVGVAPAEEAGVIRARASFSSAFAGAGMCVGGPAPVGSTLTVTNVNNNRSATCIVVEKTERVDPDVNTIVLESSTYLSIANAADAPVPVEIRR